MTLISSKTETANAGAWRVLVVEADEQRRERLCERLRDEGLDPIGCDNTADAIGLAGHEDIAVVVIDPPAGDPMGGRFLEWFHREASGCRVIVTAPPDSWESIRTAVNLGVFALVEKNGSFDRLVESVRRAVRQRQTEIAGIAAPVASDVRKTVTFGGWHWECATDRMSWSSELCKIFGLGSGQHPETRAGFLELVIEDDRERVAATLAGALMDAPRWPDLEFRIRHPGVGVRWLRSSVEVERGDDGAVSALCGAVSDETERKRPEELLKLQQLILEKIALKAELADTLTELCRLVERMVPGVYCSVMALDAEGKELNVLAAPQFTDEMVGVLDGLVPCAAAASCGTAAYLGEPVIVTDVMTDPRWEGMLDVAKRFGIGACWSIPIRADVKRVYGCFAISHGEPRSPDLFDIELLDTGSHLARIAFQRHEDELAARLHRDRLELLRAVSTAANQAADVEQAMRIVLEAVCSHMGWPVGHVYLSDGKTPATLMSSDLWYQGSPEQFRKFRQVTSTQNFEVGVGLPGRVLATGKPAWITDVTADDNFPRARLADDLGIRAGFAFPVMVRSEVAAVLEFFSPDAVEPDTRALDVMAQVGTQLGRAMERSEAAERIGRSEHRYRQLVDTTGDWVWEIDADLRYTYASPRVREILGYSPAEVLGKTPFDLMPPEEAERIRELFEPIAASKQPFALIENVNLHKDDGRRVVLETSGGPIFDEDGRLKGYRGIDRDVTARKEAEESRSKLESQLRQSQKLEAIGTLATGVAHDFSNLVTAINGYIDLAKRDLPVGHPALESLRMVHRAVDQATGVTRSLLTFAHKTKSETVPVDLARLVADTVGLLRPLMRASITLTADLAEGRSSWVLGDRTGLQQVLMNLVLNARDAMPDGGDLRLGLTRGKGADAGQRPLVLSVRDTGVGMDARTVARIFEPFYSTKQRDAGTGLGLAVVHGIVESHGGRIEVDSTPGGGTTFRILLPPCPAPGGAVEGGAAATPLGLRDGRDRALLIADQRQVRSIMASTLMQHGYEVVQADNEADAAAALAEHRDRLGLVVLDYDLPDQSGPRCLEKIESDQARTPIIVVAGPDSAVNRSGGRYQVLRKPFQMAELAGMVGELAVSLTQGSAHRD